MLGSTESYAVEDASVTPQIERSVGKAKRVNKRRSA